MTDIIQVPNPTIFVTTEITDVTKLPWKDSCRIATVADITLSGIQTIDGVVIEAGDRILVKDQGAGETNGIYVVASASWTRSVDANTSERIASTTVIIIEGTVNTGLMYALTTPNPILDTTLLVFVTLSGGNGLLSLNGLATDPQSLAVGTSGSDFVINSLGSTHTFNLPDATTGVRGIVSTGTQVFEGSKGASLEDAVNAGPTMMFSLAHNTSGVPANGIGTRIRFLSETSTTPDTPIGYIDSILTEVTHATRDSELRFQILDNGNFYNRFTANKAGCTTDSVVMPEIAFGSVVVPPASHKSLYIDSADGKLKLMTSAGASTDVMYGMASLNGLTNSAQTFTTGTAGTDTNWVSGGAIHTLNIPDATETHRGFVSATAQSFSGEKTIKVDDAVNTAISSVLNISHNTSGAPGAGIGTQLAFLSETSTTPDSPIFNIASSLSNVTHAVRESDFTLQILEAGTFVDVLTGDSDGIRYKTSVVEEIGAAFAVIPPAGKQTVFVDSADSLMKMKNSLGIVTAVGAGGGGSGITSLNAQLGTSQVFVTGSAGTDFGIVSAANVHTFNIPDANSTHRGFMSAGTQTLTGLKTFGLTSVVTAGPARIANFNIGSSGTPAINFGPEMMFKADTNGSTDRDIFSLYGYWTDATDVSRSSGLDININTFAGSQIACTFLPGELQIPQITTSAGHFYINPASDGTGIGIDSGTALVRALEINEASGNCLRLIYNDPNGSPSDYCDLLVNSSGSLTIDPSSGTVILPNNILTIGKLYFNPTGGDTGINILSGSALSRAFEINDTGGNCLRLIYNDANGSPTNYSDFLVDSSGDLTVTPSGGKITIPSDLATATDLYINPVGGDTGININAGSTLTRALEINDAVGNCLRLIYNDPNGNPSGYSDFFVDIGGSLSIVPAFKLYFNPIGLGVGININSGSALTHSFEINNSTGDCLRLIYNDLNGNPTNYADFRVGSSGNLTITPSGGRITIPAELRTATDLYINPVGGNVCINIDSGSTLTRAFEINSATGDCLRLIYNDADGSPANYSDLLVDATGNLTVTPSANLYLDPVGLAVGININSGSTLTRAFEINDSLGHCLRLIYNDSDGAPTIYSDMTVDVFGRLTIAATGDRIIIPSDLTTVSDLYINPAGGNAGLNINSGSALTRAFEINEASGNCLRLIYNDLNGGPLYYADLLVNSSGKLTIVPSSGELTLPSNLSTSSGDVFITPAGGDVGINKTFGVSLTRAFEINDTSGLCLRLTNNDASASPTNYVDLFADATGKFKIRPSGEAVGINITYAGALTRALEVNESNGDCLRLIRNEDGGSPTNYTDFRVGSSGNLTITSAGGKMTIPSDLATAADLYINPVGGDTGINIVTGSSLTRALEINDADGNCLRLIYNDPNGSPADFADLTVDSSGNLGITPAGNLYFTPIGGDVGINITKGSTLTRALEINDPGGDCLRLIRNDDSGSPVDYADLTVDSFGNLFLNPSGGTVAFPGTLHAWSNFYLLPTAVGVGIKINTGITLTHSLEINDTSGDCLRLIYNDSTGSPANYTDFSVNSSGHLDINSSGNIITFSNTEELRVIGTTSNSGMIFAPTGWVGTRVNKLELLGELTNSTDSTITLQNSSNSNTNGGILEFYKSRGTINIPLTINAGDKLGSVRGIGYDGTSFESSSAPVLRFIASEAFTPSTRGSRIELMTTIIGGTNNQVRMVVQDDGICDFKVGITLPNGGSTLDNMEIGTSYTQNWGDIYPANVPATAYVERHGKKVNMHYTGFSGTTKSSSPGSDLNGTAVTHAPKSTIKIILVNMTVGGTPEVGAVGILVTTGYVTITRLDGSNFPTSTVVAVDGFCLSYQTT
jgi:hypothetical protein